MITTAQLFWSYSQNIKMGTNFGHFGCQRFYPLLEQNSIKTQANQTGELTLLLFYFNRALRRFNNLSVILRRCLDLAGSSMLI